CLSAAVCTAVVFYVYVCHRGLHSFPTRRSSDLLGGVLLADAFLTVRQLLRMRGYLEEVDRLLSQAHSRLDERVHQLQPAWIPAGDRKSTLLNSSHVSISYAVFCLKKKKARKHSS